MDPIYCKGCGEPIVQVLEKAPGGGGTELVWSTGLGSWICEYDGNEHVPETEGYANLYARELDAHTEGLSAKDMLDDKVFNTIVDGMENCGHSRLRVERDLREWIEDEIGPIDVMNPIEALTYAILAINTAEAPDATSNGDYAYLEANADSALAALGALRTKLEKEMIG